jgi:GNAT superfamily N-acetyltransferase
VPETSAVAKQAWWQATQLEWGNPGLVVRDGDRVVAFAVYGPRSHFPRARTLGPTASDDALLLATLWVDDDERGTGVGELLVRRVLREAAQRGARAVEAYARREPALVATAARGGADGSPVAPGGCVLPEGFLVAAGFGLHHDHHAFPLFRLDLRSTVRWHESVGQALSGVRTALGRRERVPAPVRPASGAGDP